MHAYTLIAIRNGNELFAKHHAVRYAIQSQHFVVQCVAIQDFEYLDHGFVADRVGERV